MGDRPEDVAADGFPGGLQLNGGFFFIQLGVEFIQSLGILLPLHGLHGLEFDPGGEGTDYAGNKGHADHSHRIAAVTKGKGAVGVHEKIVDAEGAHQRGGQPIKVSLGQQGDEHDRQDKDQSGIVLCSSMSDQGITDQISGA